MYSTIIISKFKDIKKFARVYYFYNVFVFINESVHVDFPLIMSYCNDLK